MIVQNKNRRNIAPTEGNGKPGSKVSKPKGHLGNLEVMTKENLLLALFFLTILLSFSNTLFSLKDLTESVMNKYLSFF